MPPSSVAANASKGMYGAGTPWLEGGGVAQRLGLAVRRERGAWEVAAGVELGRGDVRAQDLTIQQLETLAYADLRWRVPLGVALPYVGARAGGGWVHQTFERDQERMVQAVFGQSAIPGRDGAVGLALLTAGAEIPFAARLFARLEAFGGAVVPHLAAGWTARPYAGGRAAVGWRW